MNGAMYVICDEWWCDIYICICGTNINNISKTLVQIFLNVDIIERTSVQYIKGWSAYLIFHDCQCSDHEVHEIESIDSQ